MNCHTLVDKLEYRQIGRIEERKLAYIVEHIVVVVEVVVQRQLELLVVGHIEECT